MEEELLYHYTSTEGLIGILGSQKNFEYETGIDEAVDSTAAGSPALCLRASNLRYMNDPSELAFGISKMTSSLRDELSPSSGTNRLIDQAKHSLRSRTTVPGQRWAEQLAVGTRSEHLAVAYLELLAEGDEELWASQMSLFYSVSFCAEGDLLGMWRNYGRFGGYALGFDKDLLIDPGLGVTANFGMSGELIEVNYSMDTDGKSIPGLGPILGVLGEGIVGPIIPTFPELTFAAQLKSHAYSEERESRLLVSAQSCMVQTPKIRSSPHGLVPYVDYWVPLHALRKIVVGPAPAQSGDPQALKAAMQTPRGERAHIEVTRSMIPFAY